MTPYTPDDLFSDIETYDTTDPVLGGTSGESNQPIKALANRTQYLYNRLGRYLDIKIITSATAITAADTFKLVHVRTTGNLAITLNAIAGFNVGAVIPFKIKCGTGNGNGKAVSITANGSEQIENGSVSVSSFYACDGEEFELVAIDSNADNIADLWLLQRPIGNFAIAGNDVFSRIQPRNAIVANGCTPELGSALLNRADYPRLWAAVSAGAIADSVWISEGMRYRAYFSTGNGTTTFRIPDLRGLHQRALDLSRGVDLGRLDSQVGGYEPDEIKSHSHALQYFRNDTSGGVQGNTYYLNNDNGPVALPPGAYTTALSGGLETRVKNYGLTPYILY